VVVGGMGGGRQNKYKRQGVQKNRGSWWNEEWGTEFALLQLGTHQSNHHRIGREGASRVGEWLDVFALRLGPCRARTEEGRDYFRKPEGSDH